MHEIYAIPDRSMNRWPDFLVIGAQKGGTTSLYHYLKQHPSVFLPQVKEPQFFAMAPRGDYFCGQGDASIERRLRIVFTEEDYLRLFADAKPEQKMGECSTYHLWSPDAPKLIHRKIPDVRMIAILRNPVDRAWSAFCHLQRDRRGESADFMEALENEPQHIEKDYNPLWRYVETGCYATQFKRYLEFFPRDQFLVLLNDELRDDPTATMHRVCEFIGVDNDFSFNFEKKLNVSGIPKFKVVHNVVKKQYAFKHTLKRILPLSVRRGISEWLFRNLMERKRMPDEARAHLEKKFRPEIDELESLMGLDLSHWKNS
ncbi:MAG: sulfotransferase [Verrucomicrobiota bacterium]